LGAQFGQGSFGGELAGDDDADAIGKSLGDFKDMRGHQHCRPGLDALWSLFGPDRAIYGSNWPVIDLVAPYASMYKIVADYFAAKGEADLIRSGDASSASSL